MMRGNATTDGGIRSSIARLVGMYVQTSLAAHVGDRVTAGIRSDEEALYRILLAVRDRVLNHVQFDHIPRAWPVMISGTGYCDQINGSVALIAARRFPRAQLYAVYDAPRKTTPHTVGRVWSDQRHEWLYFDAFYAVPLVYTRDADGTPHFLTPLPVAPVVSRRPPVMSIYSLPGWVIADYKPTFGSYLWNRAMLRVGRDQKTEVSSADFEGQSAAARHVPSRPSAPPERQSAKAVHVPADKLTIPAPPVLAGAALTSPAPIPAATHVDDRVFKRISTEFVDARIADFLGESSADLYRRISEDPEANLDDRAELVAGIARVLARENRQ